MTYNSLFKLGHDITLVFLGIDSQHLYSLYVSTVASRIQSGIDHIFHIFLAGNEMAAASLCYLFSPHLC